MRVLVSVRDLEEARQAAAAGVHFIDLKEPSEGALGGLAPGLIAEIVGMLRRDAPEALISATIGDWRAEQLDAIVRQSRVVAASGVDYVKVGVVPGPGDAALLQQLGRLFAEGLPMVPVLIADRGVPDRLADVAAALGFPALMLDTADKQAGSLLDVADPKHLAGFIAKTRASGALAGVAGALQLEQLDDLARLAPDFAGFRSAVCVADRAGQMHPGRLSALLRGVRDLDALASVVPAER